MIRSAWVAINIFIGTVILGPPLILAGLVRYRNEAFLHWPGRKWSQWALWASGVRVTIEGAEHLDPSAAQVLVGNHQSWYDVFAVAGHLPRTYHFVAKKELARIPIFGAAWRAAGHIAIDRSDKGSAIASLERAGEKLKSEHSAVVIFAEGTRSSDDGLQPFKKGAFMLALHSGVPIVPFGVAGSRRILPKGGWRVRPGPIIVRFGAPIPTAGLTPLDREALIERVRAEVLRLRDEGRRQLGPGRLERPDSSNDRRDVRDP